MGETGNGRVDLPTGTSASHMMHRTLSAAVAEFPVDLRPAGLPPTREEFKATYADALPRFEAARADSPHRTEIARHLAAASQQSFVWANDQGEEPLPDAMARPAPPLELESVKMTGARGWTPELPTPSGAAKSGAILDYLTGLVARSAATPGVVDAASWLLADGLDSSGTLDLSERRIALLGGAAELAPTRYWLAAGADVLWLDVEPPPAQLRRDGPGCGRLWWVSGGADLLTQPRHIAATISEFAAARPVDLGLYAYAPGKGREWRLTAAMNAIVASLPPATVRSVTLLVSPTTPGQLTAAEIATERRRWEERPRWQRALQRARLLGPGAGHVTSGDAAVSRSIVSIQGTGYQAAQYFEKMMTAEAWATWGPPQADEPHPLHVSANVAGVSQTRSLQHPVFDAAFGGATAFGVETFAPPTTEALNAILTARDWLNPTAPGNPAASFATDAARAQAMMTSVRVHGGLYVLPFPADAALRVSAALGAGKRPGRIPSMVRGVRG